MALWAISPSNRFETSMMKTKAKTVNMRKVKGEEFSASSNTRKYPFPFCATTDQVTIIQISHQEPSSENLRMIAIYNEMRDATHYIYRLCLKKMRGWRQQKKP
jgi:hypothetical protein